LGGGGWPKSIPTGRSAWNKRLNPTLQIHDAYTGSAVNFKVSIIKLSLLINYETSCDKLYDLNIIKYYFKNKVQLFVVFILP
jgi:hypothetical protein